MKNEINGFLKLPYRIDGKETQSVPPKIINTGMLNIFPKTDGMNNI